IGDGGLGIGGMELETALKHKLPIVTLLWNNSSWGPRFEQMPMLRGRTDPFDMLPDLRYDRMFEAIGCHGEFVTRPQEIRTSPPPGAAPPSPRRPPSRRSSAPRASVPPASAGTSSGRRRSSPCAGARAPAPLQVLAPRAPRICDVSPASAGARGRCGSLRR